MWQDASMAKKRKVAAKRKPRRKNVSLPDVNQIAFRIVQDSTRQQ
jgi:hypothetical protein